MRIGYIECFAGISGDMLMAALFDAGAPFDLLQHTAQSLGLGAELRLTRVNRSGIEASKIDVLVNGKLAEGERDGARPESEHEHGAGHFHTQAHSHPEARQNHGRSLKTIGKLLNEASLTPDARSLALHSFELLGETEARIHGVAIEKIHFHEAGAVDSIADIACCAAAIDALRLDRWLASPVNVGAGFVNCAHGMLPVPAPATAGLLKNIPTYAAGPRMELATPTGAALLRAMSCRFETPPVMRCEAIGYGAGSRNPEGFPNVLRVSVAQAAETIGAGDSGFKEEKVVVIECAIDDMSPQVLAHAAQLALERGALDVMTAPVTMKKGRVGALLTVLAQPSAASALAELLFRETSTLGLRVREESRLSLDREIVPVETDFGPVRIKAGLWHGEEWNASPEFEDCRRAAREHGAPLKTVAQSALYEWRKRAMDAEEEAESAPLSSGTKPGAPE